ncbi:hypothetical protein HHK36_027504 [Tetracentron sinense]|uniref:glucan endo-1,3-beta-D-glucosidase n=1 Tax=Tetracentron sinense TaxID=13715 RepID=A0A834YHY7_TETSI|nr:hypothetical protein HHK36_027504 [Tetracentron sinense]
MKREKTLPRIKALSLFLILLFYPGSAFKFHKFQVQEFGVNYGRVGSNLPSPEKAVELIRSLSIKHVKIFDMDPTIIKAFANTNISLSLCIPNQQIQSLATNPSQADFIIQTFILPYYRETRISSISVGNEVSMLPEFAQVLLPAMKNVYGALRKFWLHKKIPVSTPHSLAILAIWSPPSAAVFQESIAELVLRPMLTFLNRINSPFMVNLYPYLTYKGSPSIPLHFALFSEGNQTFNYTDPNTGLPYTNLFDVLVDSLYSAAFSLGFYNLPLVVTETGWPSQGRPDDTAASLQNAAIFNQRLVRHVTRKQIKGTPLRPGIPIPTFIFALFDEDQKTGGPVEKYWGLMYANGTRKYDLGPPYLRSSI